MSANAARMRKIVARGYETNDYAKTFRTVTNPSRFERRFLDALVQRVGVKARVLDLGCGTGVPFDKYLVERP
jgi:ubiquinone/menaquinone biosynthesis C-methylase UbiE